MTRPCTSEWMKKNILSLPLKWQASTTLMHKYNSWVLSPSRNLQAIKLLSDSSPPPRSIFFSSTKCYKKIKNQSSPCVWLESFWANTTHLFPFCLEKVKQLLLLVCRHWNPFYFLALLFYQTQTPLHTYSETLLPCVRLCHLVLCCSAGAWWSTLAHINSLPALQCWHSEWNGSPLTHQLVPNTHTHNTHVQRNTHFSTNTADFDEWASMKTRR